MSLDMFAFSLGRSEAFSKPRDILNYRGKQDRSSLPQFVIGGPFAGELGLADIFDPGTLLLETDLVLPGSTLLHRWCKHPDLYGWMKRRWNALRWNKKPKQFNAEDRVPLTVQDLDDLEHAVRHGRLPKTTGFFFGQSSGHEVADDLAFIEAARKELAAGKFVYFTSWW